MKRRNFLKRLGALAALPFVPVKALLAKPVEPPLPKPGEFIACYFEIKDLSHKPDEDVTITWNTNGIFKL